MPRATQRPLRARGQSILPALQLLLRLGGQDVLDVALAVFERQVDLLEGAAQVERLIEMATIADTRLNDAAAAVDLWRRVLSARG